MLPHSQLKASVRTLVDVDGFIELARGKQQSPEVTNWLQENYLWATRELAEVGAAGADSAHSSAKNLMRVGLLRHRFLHRRGLNLLS